MTAAETPRTGERATLTLEECEQLEDAWIDAERSSDLRPAVEEIVTDRLAAAVARAEAAEAKVAAVEALIRSDQADQFRDEACRNAVELPYASNRYIRLLDDLRAVVPTEEER